MTHEDYERDSILRGMQHHDQAIESLEQALKVAHESRREFINRHSINKKCADCKEENKQGQMVD